MWIKLKCMRKHTTAETMVLRKTLKRHQPQLATSSRTVPWCAFLLFLRHWSNTQQDLKTGLGLQPAVILHLLLRHISSSPWMQLSRVALVCCCFWRGQIKALFTDEHLYSSAVWFLFIILVCVWKKTVLILQPHKYTLHVLQAASRGYIIHPFIFFFALFLPWAVLSVRGHLEGTSQKAATATDPENRGRWGFTYQCRATRPWRRSTETDRCIVSVLAAERSHLVSPGIN